MPTGLVQEAADEPAADTASLMVRGGELDPLQVDLRRPVLDVEHADFRAVGGDDLPSVRGERAGVEAALNVFRPSPRWP